MSNSKLDKMFENDFIRVPRPFIRKFNLATAVLLSEIYSEYVYWEEHNGLEKGGWFYSTIENMYNNTGLSEYQQRVACKELEAYGIIQISYRGLPKKRYFKFNIEAINKLHNDFQLNCNSKKDKKEPETVEFDKETLKRSFLGFSF